MQLSDYSGVKTIFTLKFEAAQTQVLIFKSYTRLDLLE